MAITFLEKRKKLRYLVPISAIIVLIIIFIIWYGFFHEEKQPLPEPVFQPPVEREIKIDFQFLKSPIFKQLILFEQIPAFEQEIGRENPFILY